MRESLGREGGYNPHYNREACLTGGGVRIRSTAVRVSGEVWRREGIDGRLSESPVTGAAELGKGEDSGGQGRWGEEEILGRVISNCRKMIEGEGKASKGERVHARGITDLK